MKKSITIFTLFMLCAICLSSCAPKDPYPLHTLVRTGTEKQIKAFLSNPKRAEQNINAVSDKGTTPLIDALDAGRDISIIKLLVEAGADVNAETTDKDTSLARAIRLSSVTDETVMYLIDAGADINNASIPANYPLYAAVTFRKPEFVETLLKKNPDFSNVEVTKLLYNALAAKQEFSLIQSLINAGMPIPYSSAWEDFIEQAHTQESSSGTYLACSSLLFPPLPENEPALKTLWKQWDKEQKENPRFIEIILKHSSRERIVAESITKLIGSMKQNWDRFFTHFEFMEEHNAQSYRQCYLEEVLASTMKNATNTEATKPTNDDIIWILKNYQIDLNFKLSKDSKNTPLLFALQGDPELARILLEYGADPNYPAVKNTKGNYDYMDPDLPYNILYKLRPLMEASSSEVIMPYSMAKLYYSSQRAETFKRYSKANDYFEDFAELLEAHGAFGFLRQVNALNKALDNADYKKAASLIKECPELTKPERYLIDFKDNFYYPVYRAFKSEDTNTLLFLAEQGFSLGFAFPIRDREGFYDFRWISLATYAIRSNLPEKLRFIMSKRFEKYWSHTENIITNDDLKRAALMGYTENLKICADLGVSVTTIIHTELHDMVGGTIYDENLLHLAVSGGHIDTVRYLLDAGAAVNALASENQYGDGPSFYIERTPLNYCSESAEHQEIAELLRSRGGLTFGEIIKDPVKYRSIIEAWHRPICTGVENDEGKPLLLNASNNKSRKFAEGDRFRVLNSEDGFYYLFDKNWVLWKLSTEYNLVFEEQEQLNSVSSDTGLTITKFLD